MEMESHVVEGLPSAKTHMVDGVTPLAKLADASSVSPNLPAQGEVEKKPVLCIFSVVDWSVTDLNRHDWYAFDISDDPKHNQAPTTPPPSFILPPALSRYYRKIPDRLIPFHEDDDHASVNLQSLATCHSQPNVGWAVLGPTLYHFFNHGSHNPDCVGSVEEDPGTCVERIDLGKGSREWVSLAKTPSPIGTANCLVLLGKLYCLSNYSYRGGRAAPRPWAMAYDPGLDEWEPLPDPLCLPSRPLTFTAAVDGGGQLGPAIVVASDGLLQIYHVNLGSWGLEPLDCNHVLSRPTCRRLGKAVAVGNMLYWYATSEKCLVGYDLVTRNWFRGDLDTHNYDYESVADYPPSLAHLRQEGVDINKFCLSWVTELPTRPDTQEKKLISRLHCLKVRVVITNKIISEKGIFCLDVSIITCQSYLVGGLKGFRGAMLV